MRAAVLAAVVSCAAMLIARPLLAQGTMSLKVTSYPDGTYKHAQIEWIWAPVPSYISGSLNGVIFCTMQVLLWESPHLPPTLVDVPRCGVPTTWTAKDGSGKTLVQPFSVTFDCPPPTPTPTATPLPTLTAPANVRAVGSNVDTVDVTWTQSPYTTSCKVGYSLSGGAPFAWVNQMGTGYTTVTGLAKSTTYYFVANCSGPYGTTPNSAPVAGKTTALPQ